MWFCHCSAHLSNHTTTVAVVLVGKLWTRQLVKERLHMEMLLYFYFFWYSKDCPSTHEKKMSWAAWFSHPLAVFFWLAVWVNRALVGVLFVYVCRSALSSVWRSRETETRGRRARSWKTTRRNWRSWKRKSACCRETCRIVRWGSLSHTHTHIHWHTHTL